MSLEDDLIKKIPVDKLYDDLFQPSLKLLGTGIRDICELAFTPFELLTERKRMRLKEHLKRYEEKVKLINEKDHVSIPDEFGIPILQKLAQTSQKELSEKYLNLLAKASSAKEIENVHPRYIKILEELSLDEIRIIDELGESFQTSGHLIVGPESASRRFKRSKSGFAERKASPLQTFHPLIGTLKFNNKLPEYLENLLSLGLHEFSIEERYRVSPDWPRRDGDIDQIFQLLLPDYDEAKEYARRLQTHQVYMAVGLLHLTRFGTAFYKACLPIE